MTNTQIYRRTFRFSVMRVLCTLLGLVLLLGLPVVAFLIAYPNEDACIIGCFVAFVLGIAAYALIAKYAGYLFTAGQIAMMEQGLSKGELPEDVYSAGKAAVKARFVTASVYFALKSITDGISREITKGLDGIGKLADGGNDGNTVVSAITGLVSAVIAIMLEYINYCSLAWVFHKGEQNAFKSTCDGAVIYFQNWKTLLANVVKVLGFSLLSLVVIGAPLMLAGVALLSNIGAFAELGAVIDAALELDAGVTVIGAGVIAGLLLFSGIHSALVKPLILVSVMRRYLEAGDVNPPKIDIYEKLSKLSKSFRKAFEKAEPSQAAAV